MDVELKLEQNGNRARLTVRGELCIYDAFELKGQLLEYLQQNKELEVDLGGVGGIDCAGFQLLYLLKREAKSADKALRLVNHSPAVLEMLGLLNMEAYFGDPVVLAN